MVRKKFWLNSGDDLGGGLRRAGRVHRGLGAGAVHLHDFLTAVAHPRASRRANSAGIRRSEIACPIGVCVLAKWGVAESWHGSSAKAGRTRSALTQVSPRNPPTARPTPVAPRPAALSRLPPLGTELTAALQ